MAMAINKSPTVDVEHITLVSDAVQAGVGDVDNHAQVIVFLDKSVRLERETLAVPVLTLLRLIYWLLQELLLLEELLFPQASCFSKLLLALLG